MKIENLIKPFGNSLTYCEKAEEVTPMNVLARGNSMVKPLSPTLMSNCNQAAMDKIIIFWSHNPDI